MKWLGHIAHLEESRGAYRVLMGKRERNLLETQAFFLPFVDNTIILLWRGLVSGLLISFPFSNLYTFLILTLFRYFRYRKEVFFSSKTSEPAICLTQPFKEHHKAFHSVIKWPKHESDHSPLSSAEVMNEWSYKSSPPIHLHSVHRDIFTFFNFYLTSWIPALSYGQCVIGVFQIWREKRKGTFWRIWQLFAIE